MRTPDPFAKDCGCVTHDGPHWLHMDRVDRRRNRELVQHVRDNPPHDFVSRDQAVALLAYVAEQEVLRLTTKAAEMRKRGITTIPAHLSDESTHDREVRP